MTTGKCQGDHQRWPICSVARQRLTCRRYYVIFLVCGLELYRRHYRKLGKGWVLLGCSILCIRGHNPVAVIALEI